MEQAESNLDSLRVFTTKKWFVQLGMAARGIACCSKCDAAGRIATQVPVRLSFVRVSHPLTIPSFFRAIERWRFTIAPTSRQDVQQTNPNNEIAVPSSGCFFGENPFCAGTQCHATRRHRS